ncbi:hypothetical protein [Mycolicibacterium sp. P1-5]|uniref:hypothetical protein n=1 Tax=Mycolicibacterium sp. P1-5 TaxID=2024617 RepID=UPI0011EF6C24|nr:hypothetical protein [Mycolicibacterium sp. P1-5]KAA0109230.1 hypothetical protein CIW47_11715 [Mycolicibacterium sp. P1-5]
MGALIAERASAGTPASWGTLVLVGVVVLLIMVLVVLSSGAGHGPLHPLRGVTARQPAAAPLDCSA